MKMKPILFATIIVTSLAYPRFAFSEEASVVQLQTAASGIEYVSGGVGVAEKNAMEALRKNYNLRLTFARPRSGAYLVDVKVMIENGKKEKVLNVVSHGPLFFAKMPAGTYKVTAEFEGNSQAKTATVGGGQPRGLVYYFKKG